MKCIRIAASALYALSAASAADTYARFDPSLALAIQQQIAGFLLSGGKTIPDGNALVRTLFGKDLFESPQFLTEGYNYIH